MPISEVFNMDCVSYMQTLPDKFFDLAIVDPPYGETCKLSGGKAKKDGYAKYWDKITDKGNWNVAPSREYFNELFRVSKNQIIWGANHYPQHLNPSSGWIFWDKGQKDFSFSDGELAYSSFICKLRAVIIHRSELHKESRFHPTQKPIALYKWLIEKYAKAGDKIFDSHMGSQSSRIAAFNMGFDYWGCELDEEYFNDGNKRFIRETMQQSLFTPIPTKAEITQTTIFQQ
jgi:site-specific DNA-methyltransferase (adenine-specific)